MKLIKEFRRALLGLVFNKENTWWYRSNNTGAIPDAIDTEIAEYATVMFDECKISADFYRPAQFFNRTDRDSLKIEERFGSERQLFVMLCNDRLLGDATVVLTDLESLLEGTLRNLEDPVLTDRDDLLEYREFLHRHLRNVEEAIGKHNGS